MSIEIKVLDEAARPAWDRFVLSACPDATFFHLSGWKTVIARAFRQRCRYVYAVRGGEIVGVLPMVHLRSLMFGNRLVSNAFTIGGGAAAVDEEAYAALDEDLMRQAKTLGVSAIEVRRPARLHDGEGWVRKSDVYANFSRALAGEEDACLKQIPRKQRAVVRKALGAGVLTDTLDSTPTMFFPLYAFSMRNMGTPVFGARFFSILMKEFKDRSDCLTVHHQGRPIASVLNFYFRDAVMPYYTGCEIEARALGANDYMYWRLMRTAVERGYTMFDFGRSKVGTGPYSFKKNWGFEPVPITQEHYLPGGGVVSEINPLNPRYRAFIAMWRRLPLPLANLLGPIVVREIG